jgi:hypothetical protein
MTEIALPAPGPELYDLLALLRRPMPLSNLRPAAVATRRGELRIEAGRDGTILAMRGWP